MGKRAKFLISILFISACAVFYNSVFANPSVLGTGSTSVYKVTLNKFELDNGNGTTSVTAFEGTSSTLDIASAADTNTSVGNFMSGLVVPDGNYSRVKPTPSGTFTVAGSVSYGGATYYTTSTIGAGGGCLTSITGPAQECTVTVAMGTVDWENLPSTITVTGGTPNYKCRVKFNTSAALGLYDMGGHYELMPEQPVTSMSLIPQ